MKTRFYIYTIFHKMLLGIIILASFGGCSKIKLRRPLQTVSVYPNWTMYGGNPQRTHVYPSKTNPPLDLYWTKRLNALAERSLILVDSVLFFGTQHEHIHAYHIFTKKKIGKINVDFPATCAYSNNTLFIARRYGDNTLYALDLSKGKWLWKIDAGDIESEPLITPTGIVVSALYKHIDMYAMDTGTRLWTFETGDHIYSSPAYANGKIFFGCDDGYLYAINSSDGTLLWKFKSGASIRATPAVNVNRKIVFIGSSDFYFYALNMVSGEELWRFETNGQITQGAAVTQNSVVFGSTDHNVYCLNSRNGQLRWQIASRSVVGTSPVIAGSTVYWGSLDHYLYAVELKTGKTIWTYETKGRIRTDPIVWGPYLVTASEDDYIYVFKMTDNK